MHRQTSVGFLRFLAYSPTLLRYVIETVANIIIEVASDLWAIVRADLWPPVRRALAERHARLTSGRTLTSVRRRGERP